MIERVLCFFHFQEVEKSRRLQAILACLLFYCFLIFQSWSRQPGLTYESIATLNFMPMWPVEEWPIRLLLPTFYHRLFLELLSYLALAAAVSIFAKRWIRWAFALLLILTILELYFYLHDLRLVANFFHVHLYLTFFFLFSSQKLLFFRIGLWLVYWLAALVKMTPSWLSAEYFNSVPGKLPLLTSDPTLVKLACLGLLVVELGCPLLWLSSNRRVRQVSMVVLLLFHVYSGFIVGHWYTTLMIPLVCLALIPFSRSLTEDYKPAPRHKFLFLAFGIFLMGGLWNFLLPGDVRTTAEGRYHGLFMFDANRRAQASIDIDLGDGLHEFLIIYSWPQKEVLDWAVSVRYRFRGGEFKELRRSVRVGDRVLFNPAYFRRNSSRMFSDPYIYYFYAKQVFRRFRPTKMRLKLEQQLDGHSYSFPIIELTEDQLASLEYSGFWRNSWIKVPGPETPEQYQWP